MSLLKRLLRPRLSLTQEFPEHYYDWRAKRLIAIVSHYGPSYFYGKRILEVGCGDGTIGLTLASLGAKVTCSDARPQYLGRISAINPTVTVMRCDLDSDFPEGIYDMVIHMGVLYHLKDFKFALARAVRNCCDLVLESEVMDSSDPNDCLLVQEQGPDQALNLKGCRPSPMAIEKELALNGMSFLSVVDSRINSSFHVYDWPIQNTGTWRHGLRRFWFCRRV